MNAVPRAPAKPVDGLIPCHAPMRPAMTVDALDSGAS